MSRYDRANSGVDNPGSQMTQEAWDPIGSVAGQTVSGGVGVIGGGLKGALGGAGMGVLGGPKGALIGAAIGAAAGTLIGAFNSLAKVVGASAESMTAWSDSVKAMNSRYAYINPSFARQDVLWQMTQTKLDRDWSKTLQGSNEVSNAATREWTRERARINMDVEGSSGEYRRIQQARFGDTMGRLGNWMHSWTIAPMQKGWNYASGGVLEAVNKLLGSRSAEEIKEADRVSMNTTMTGNFSMDALRQLEANDPLTGKNLGSGAGTPVVGLLGRGVGGDGLGRQRVFKGGSREDGSRLRPAQLQDMRKYKSQKALPPKPVPLKPGKGAGQEAASSSKQLSGAKDNVAAHATTRVKKPDTIEEWEKNRKQQKPTDLGGSSSDAVPTSGEMVSRYNPKTGRGIYFNNEAEAQAWDREQVKVETAKPSGGTTAKATMGGAGGTTAVATAGSGEPTKAEDSKQAVEGVTSGSTPEKKEPEKRDPSEIKKNIEGAVADRKKRGEEQLKNQATNPFQAVNAIRDALYIRTMHQAVVQIQADLSNRVLGSYL